MRWNVAHEGVARAGCSRFGGATGIARVERSWSAVAMTFALALAVALCVAFCVGVVVPSKAYAAKIEPYDYTVRVFGGNQGTYNGGNPYVVTVSAGENFRLDKSAVSIADDSMYYVKGFRVSGQDALCDESVTVNEDMDFMVAYGVAGDMVSYTVSFVEYGTGRALANDAGATSVTFYGKQGDKPIVPYEYVAGYRPRYLNVTGTLGAEGSNSWTLEYIPLDTAAGGAGGAAAADGTAAGSASAAGGAETADGAAGTPAGGAETADGAAGTPAGGAETAAPQTEQIIDLDNPLAHGKEADDVSKHAGGSADDPQVGLPLAQIFGTAAAVVALGALGLLLVSRKRKNVERRAGRYGR